MAKELGVPESDLALSMGMSSDFEEATRMGSTSVRVGSSIFGAREYPKRGDGDDGDGDKLAKELEKSAKISA